MFLEYDPYTEDKDLCLHVPIHFCLKTNIVNINKDRPLHPICFHRVHKGAGFIMRGYSGYRVYSACMPRPTVISW